MKTNHKLSALQILLAVLFGLVLAFHRQRAASGGEMFLVALAAALILAATSAATEKTRKKLQLKAACPDKLAFSLLAAAGFLFLLSAVLFLLQQEFSSSMSLIVAALFGFSGVATLLRLTQRDSGKLAAVFSLIPIFALSFYLLIFYRTNGDNPYLSTFGYEMAVLLVTLLGVYGAVAGRFEKPRPLFRVILCSVGICLLMQEGCASLLMPVTVFNIPGFSLGTLVMMMASGLVLCHGVGYPPVREVFEADDSDEDEPQDA
ncbi:MAG: hypothetical protein IKU58_04215 [Clostridia bacterium]|nr:hypothetical protein [Clostridia bacterium]